MSKDKNNRAVRERQVKNNLARSSIYVPCLLRGCAKTLHVDSSKERRRAQKILEFEWEFCELYLDCDITTMPLKMLM